MILDKLPMLNHLCYYSICLSGLIIILPMIQCVPFISDRIDHKDIKHIILQRKHRIRTIIKIPMQA